MGFHNPKRQRGINVAALSTTIPRSVGKEEAESLSHLLPVVAMGLLPHIDRRATFSQRAPPFSAPHRLSGALGNPPGCSVHLEEFDS
jgi:hypothetical protein